MVRQSERGAGERGLAGRTYAQELNALQSLARDDGYHLHLAEKGYLGVGEPRRQWEGHCVVAGAILGIIVCDLRCGIRFASRLAESQKGVIRTLCPAMLRQVHLVIANREVASRDATLSTQVNARGSQFSGEIRQAEGLQDPCQRSALHCASLRLQALH